jgi:formylglycine-generating enzyme required for sulfatase activity
MYPPRYWQKFIDQWFGSKYLLKEFLGCGAFGAVFRADEMLADRVMQSVAIKVVVADMERLDEQLAELQLSVRLRHPHLINGITCEQGDLGGDLCLGLVMELADHSLESYIQSHPEGLSVETVKTIVVHLAQGLAVLHKDGIVHRDLKPANVLLVEDCWKLADFGIARSLEDKTSTQTNASQQIGTIAYMPPEAYSGKISPAWDLWSLGVMIHQLVTGRHPFPTQSAPELMRMVLTEEPQIDVRLKSPLQEVITGCLLKDPKQRWEVNQVLIKFKTDSSEPVVQYQNSVRLGALEIITENLGERVELELIRLSGGSFMMGSPETDIDAHESQKPQHRVNIKSFAIGKYPVTQSQYEVVMGQNPSEFKGNPYYPVERVSWNSAQVFCKKISEQTGKKYRLPTEAEWEYACRAGTITRYYFGDDPCHLRDHAWFKENSNKKTHAVGQKKPNLWGLYDMHGNICEWCEDSWHDNYEGAPINGSAWNEKHSLIKILFGEMRVLRGGSWFYPPPGCGSADRDKDKVNDGLAISGFRVVLDLSST